MHKSSPLVLLILGLLVNLGCSKSSDSKPPVYVESVMNEARELLEPAGLGYYGETERGFRTDGRIVEPCSQTLLTAIDAAVSKLQSVQNQLAPQGPFKGLLALQTELHQYCSSDHAQIKKCLPPDGSILASLNRDVPETAVVSPALVPFDISSTSQDNYSYGIFRLNAYEGGAVGVSFIRFKKDGRFVPDKLDRDDAKFYENHRQHLTETSQCIDSLAPQSATGKILQAFAKAASTERYY